MGSIASTSGGRPLGSSLPVRIRSPCTAVAATARRNRVSVVLAGDLHRSDLHSACPIALRDGAGLALRLRQHGDVVAVVVINVSRELKGSGSSVDREIVTAIVLQNETVARETGNAPSDDVFAAPRMATGTEKQRYA